MKLQNMVAAAALVAAGAASAAIDKGASGNGSFWMLAFDNLGGTNTAGIFDLGYTLNDFVSADGTGSFVSSAEQQLTWIDNTVVWDFINNTVTKNGVAVTTLGSNDWTAAYNRLMANISSTADLRFVVGANDTTGTGEEARYLITGNIAQSTTARNAQDANSTTNLARITTINDIFTPVANKGTIGSADNGAYTFIAADGAHIRANGYVVAGDAFANNWRNLNKLSKAMRTAGEVNGVWLADASGAERLIGAVDFNAAAGTLTYSSTPIYIPSFVPEPSTYALALAGLACLWVARSRV